MLDVIVIGGGQAGLAAAYYLQQKGLDYLILEANEHSGDSWRRRWEGLSLFSPQRYNLLPGSPTPKKEWDLPTRLEIADYLAAYAKHHELKIRCSTTVAAVKKHDHFTVVTEDGKELDAHQVIVASGAYRTPSVPARLSAAFASNISQYHSSEIGKVSDIVDRETSLLIVGAGASGQQLSRLALEANAGVILAGPEVPNLPRNLLGKDIYWWLYHSGMMGLRTDKAPGRWLADTSGGTVTVAEAPIVADRNGTFIRTTARLTDYRQGLLHLSGASHKTATVSWPQRSRGVVVWCTGYANTYPWLPSAALDETGTPLHDGGKSRTIDGLYYIGLHNLRHTNSSLVGGVGRDARQITDLLIRRAR